eukprot:CAMPEP_0171308752 /NCGR_PEP_ID=MMETSP0816-20121228/18861_1 /TAXON_ID=420281 /ORGANISM="Proboscia inermis, Strain CCAP1064/1" /LENGTH=65 /DNA_ID=CAMNT_0011791829 /DNA_START=71 /DNA_END=268 /DNA_ORIENTATION=+
MLHPILLIAIAILVGAIVLIWKNMKQAKSILKDLLEFTDTYNNQYDHFGYDEDEISDKVGPKKAA